jgi:hypothetical protein
MKKVLVLLVFLVGCAVQPAPEGNVMPTNNEIVDIFKRRMPELTASEAQDIVDYFSQVDSAVSHFRGGDILEVGEIRATRGIFEYPPLESGTWTKSNLVTAADGTNISWGQEVRNNGVVKWTSADPTKFYVQPRIGGQGLRVTLTAQVNFDANNRIIGVLNMYDIDDTIIAQDALYNIDADLLSSGTVMTVDPDTHYFIVQAFSNPQDTYSYKVTITEIQ